MAKQIPQVPANKTRQLILSLSLAAAALSSATQAANVASVSASPNPFSPGASTTISYSLNQSALLWLNIYDQTNALKRSLVRPVVYTAINRAAGGNNDPWNGNDNSGSPLAAGLYNYRIDNVFFSAHYSLGQINPHDIAVSPATPNIIWATAKTSPYVFKSTNGGTSWQGVSTGANAKDYGIVISGDGQKIFIANDGQSRLFTSTNGGSSWTQSGSFPANSTTVSDVATSANGAILYVLDYMQRLIYRSANGGGSWSTCSAAGLALTSGPRGIATDAAGTTVIVADSAGDRLFKSTNSCANFSLISAITSGTGDGNVRYPYQVAIQSDGKFWVSDRGNNRVQQFDANGTRVMMVGGTGTGNYQFTSGDKFFGIGLVTSGSDNSLFVADYDNMRIKKLGYDNWLSPTPLQIGTGTGGVTNNQTITGTASASLAGGTAIAVSMPYSNDQNTNNTYKVEYKLSSAATWSTWVASAAHAASPYTTSITGLSTGASYDVRMTYIDPDGVSGANPQTVSNLTAPTCGSLRTPTSLTAIDTPADDGDSITLSWTPSTSTCVTEQRIYRSVNGGSNFTLLDTIPGNTINNYIDSRVEIGTSYSYRLRAYDGSQESGDTNNASAVPVDDLAPATPTNVAATPGNAKVFLYWERSSSWDAYEQRVYRSTNGGSNYSLLATLGSAAMDYIDTTVSNGATYYYVISAFDNSNESARSAAVSAAALASRINPPTSVITLAGDNKVQLSWNASSSSGITQQRIYRSTTPGTGYTLISTIANNSTLSYTDTSTLNGTSYYYVIRAFNGSTESGNSNESRAIPIANFKPTAFNGSLSVLKDGTTNGVLSASDVNGDLLKYSIVSNGGLGTATITNSAAGTYRYVPRPGVTGTDTFTFKANDGNADSNIATVTVTIGTTVATITLNSGWNLISIPTRLSPTNDFTSLLSDDLGVTPEVYAWPSYGIAGSFEGYYLPATTAKPGQAYWLVVYKDGTVIDDQFNAENTNQCDSASFPGVQCVDIALQAGGNLIGNPYLTVKDLLQSSQVKVCNNTKSNGCKLATDWESFSEAVTSRWLLNTLYSYNPATGTYEYVQSVADGSIKLAPWEGWWLRVETGDSLILRFYK